MFWLYRLARFHYRLKCELFYPLSQMVIYSTWSICLRCAHVVKCFLVSAADAQGIGIQLSWFDIREKHLRQGHFLLCGGCCLPSQSSHLPASPAHLAHSHFSTSLLTLCSWPPLPCHNLLLVHCRGQPSWSNCICCLHFLPPAPSSGSSSLPSPL